MSSWSRANITSPPLLSWYTYSVYNFKEVKTQGNQEVTKIPQVSVSATPLNLLKSLFNGTRLQMSLHMFNELKE